jgi:hypothetical protein
LAEGGQIVKVQEPIQATTQDVLDYLQSCGVAAKYSESDPKIYWCEGKRVRLSHVVVVANRQRRTQQLPPFAVEL